MTTKIRAAVYAMPAIIDTPVPRHWIAHPTARSETGRLIDPDSTRVVVCPSWPEAMQEAYRLIDVLDRELMDEVHEERATRRDPAPIPATRHTALQEATA